MKKQMSKLLLFVVAANLGLASVAFAQTTVDGSQGISCPEGYTVGFNDTTPTDGTDGNVYKPDSFVFMSVPVSNTNMTTTNGSDFYYEEDDTSFPITTSFANTDTVSVYEDVPEGCQGPVGAGFSLVVDATAFTNSVGVPLHGTGPNLIDDVVVDPLTPNDDYFPIMSLSTSGIATCTGSCITPGAFVETKNEAKDGSSNAFLSETNGDMTLSFSTVDNNTVLMYPMDNLGTTELALNPINLYNNTAGIDGVVDIPGLDFHIALPARVSYYSSDPAENEYTSTVTYTFGEPEFIAA